MKGFLLPFFFLYQKISQIRNIFYDHQILKLKKVELPVISVGNLSFGGSGKTPFTIALAEDLVRNGYKTAILSRGYKGLWEKKGGIVSNGKEILCSWREAGDEAFLIAKNLPQAGVFVGKNRVISAEKAIKLGFEIIILDDGFQYRHLARDVDLVLVNPSNNYFLREPLSSLKRADIVLFREEIDLEMANRIKLFNPNIRFSKYSLNRLNFIDLNESSIIPIDAFYGKKALVFCGIANPLRFKKDLEEMGINIKYFLNFPDHYSYPEFTIANIIEKRKELKTDLLLTTEKDAIKWKEYRLSNIPIYYLKIKIDLAEDFSNIILSLLDMRGES
ncbi:MAG: tetraacyldisaccharide 4'-kinase [Candidatus Aminicenantia bacterium]